MGNAVITGEDESSVAHTLDISLSIDITDIGSTAVSEPNLEGKEVTYSNGDNSSTGLAEKYIGTYKSNIVDETDGKFTKLGERVFEITEINDGVASGKFYTTFKEDGVPEYFEFTNCKGEYGHYIFEYTDENGETHRGRFYTTGSRAQNIDLSLECETYDNGNSFIVEDLNCNGMYIRVFD